MNASNENLTADGWSPADEYVSAWEAMVTALAAGPVGEQRLLSLAAKASGNVNRPELTQEVLRPAVRAGLVYALPGGKKYSLAAKPTVTDGIAATGGAGCLRPPAAPEGFAGPSLMPHQADGRDSLDHPTAPPSGRLGRDDVRASVECPACGAAVGAACVGTSGRERTRCHRARWDAARPGASPGTVPVVVGARIPRQSRGPVSPAYLSFPQGFTLTTGQEAAVRGIGEFMRSDRQVFVLSGYAGTGKTTITTQCLPDVPGGVIHAALSGKAVDVLRSKGAEKVSTVHGLIYRMVGEEPFCRACGAAGSGCGHKRPGYRPRWVRQDGGPLRDAGLLVLDEASMIDQATAEDLLSFGTKILVVGDPFQLPPINGTGHLLKAKPDAMLTEVTRTAKDSPIIELATRLRAGKASPAVGRMVNGEMSVVVMPRADLDLTDPALAGDDSMVVVGLHVTRASVNGKIRAAAHGGQAAPLPLAGDKVLCRRNNRDEMIFNGQQFRCVADVTRRDGDKFVNLPIDAERTLKAWSVMFTNPKAHEVLRPMTWPQRRQAHEFAHGYAMVCHSAQGSEWNNVTVVDESAVFATGSDPGGRRWLYTAVTRAVEKVVVAL